METTPPGKSTGREIVERAVAAALGSVPVVGNALAVTFVTALGCGWRNGGRSGSAISPRESRSCASEWTASILRPWRATTCSSTPC